ncbi:hypothetical protein DFH08DRAFT_952631 [Mycena albidolilacea]|uniref:Uncharacterized protein n=1 Tax=Mycena albidolilacea TaxID=1033008 RepID=A0AAD7AI61_9AGAR|nr:hypothetical protein DFH08DRAFT_952631 [Mycena albidolilacea]
MNLLSFIVLAIVASGAAARVSVETSKQVLGAAVKGRQSLPEVPDQPGISPNPGAGAGPSAGTPAAVIAPVVVAAPMTISPSTSSSLSPKRLKAERQVLRVE